MVIRISKANLKLWLILLLFAAFCFIIGYALGMQYGLDRGNTFFQNYINETCECLK